MLKLNPFERLGCGPSDQKLDFESLKAHRFFNGINFNTIHKQESPLLNIYEDLEHETIEFDDSDEDDHHGENIFGDEASSKQHELLMFNEKCLKIN